MPNQDQERYIEQCYSASQSTINNADNTESKTNGINQPSSDLSEEAQGQPPQQPFQQQLNELQNKITQVEKRFDERIQTLEAKVQELTGELAATRQTLEEKTGELAATKLHLEAKTQELDRTKAERFQRGWELFKIYQKKEASFHDTLKGVIPRADNFESFICSGVSSDSLETLWDIIKDRRYRGETKDLQFLQDLFEYRLELFNASKAAPVYEMLKVQVGDPYKQREQVVDSSGSSQGVVREVCLQGYRNRIVDKIIRQTIVILE